MKAIIVSEAAFVAVRDLLIREVTKGAQEREARAKSGDMTGMGASPEPMIHNRISKAFEQLRDA